MFRYTNRNRTKRRRVMTRKLKPELHRRPQIFENSRFYIHPYFINGSRRKVLHELIVKYGGSYTLVLDDETTHILVDEDLSSGKFWRSLGDITLSPNVNVLMVSWLSASVRASQCLNPVDYEIRRPRFETSHRCTASTSTAAAGTVDNQCVFTDTSSSSVVYISEDADVELPYLEAAREEASTYDDGKYDEETSCDDEWIIFIGNPEPYDAEALNAPAIVNSEPSNTSGIVNSGPSDLSGIINTGLPDTSGIVNTPPDTSGIVNTLPDISGIVNAGPSGIINSGPLNTSGNVNAGPLDASGIVNSEPSDSSAIVNSEPSGSSAVVNSELSYTSGIANSGPSNTSGIVNSASANTSGIVNSCTPNSCSTDPAPNSKKRKLEETFPSSRPNTLAARLSRVRVRRIPEHLREPGGPGIIVDLNGESFSQPSGKNFENNEIINNNSSYVDLNRTETNGADKKFKVAKETEDTLYDDKNFESQSDNYASVHKFANASHFVKPSTESSIEASEDKNKKSIAVFSLDEQFDAESVNEVSQVVTMIVESVCEVAVNEKIINESVVEISKHAMENVDSTEETLKNENIYTELVSDVLLRVVEDVVKAETDPEIKKVKFENLSENFIQFSEIPNMHDFVKIPVNVLKAENKNTLEDETQKENNSEKLAKIELSKNTSQENTCTELIEVESAVSELPVAQLPINSNVSAYPVQLFCSTAFECSAVHQSLLTEQMNRKPVEYITADIYREYFVDDQAKQEPAEYMTADINLENYSNDQTKQETVEYITADINLPSNLDSSECEPANNTDSSCKNPESEIVRDKRSCKRPDITGPNIFFPFPIPRSSLHSRVSSKKGPSSLLSGAVNNPNREIIKKLQLLYESFKRSGEKWRMDVYEKAILALTTHTKKIESFEGIRFLSCISRNIAMKVLQISQTGHLEEIDEICNRPSEEIRKTFSRAWGIGPRKARELYREGYDTLADLRTKASLSPPLLVGLKYYDELNTKMPWKEARAIYLRVLNAAFAKYPFLQGDGCSSLRRRKKFCGHVSVLLRLPVGYYKNDHKILPDVVAELHKSGYLVDDLIRHEEIGNQTKYVGIFRLGRIFKFRRVEITVCIHEEYGCALMFLTGSSYFNRAIQQFALKRNMLLDGHSLRLKILNELGGTADCPKLYAPTEQAIFQFLMLNYVPPEKRDRFTLPSHL